jgi:malate dehydrogenase (oxaloacetate-decarboxylating)
MVFDTRLDAATGRAYVAVHTKGRELLLDPRTNKGTAFPLDERDALALHGLLPPGVCTFEQQLERTYENFSANPTPIAKYNFLVALQDRNEVLFFRLLSTHIDEMMPIVYTPTVGEACQRFSHIFRRTRGLYVGWDQRGRIADVLRNHAAKNVSIIVVTDGERILGLGDQGAGGMGIPIGKLSLYTLCAGIPPDTTLPMMLDVGTENEERLADPLYLGLRRHRVRGDEYQAFVDEFVDAVRAVFPGTILQWEDFLKENAMHQLERFRERLPSFNDDIQGTAAVTVAGMLASLRVSATKLGERRTKSARLADQRLLIAGAGASAQGIVRLFVAALIDEGIDERSAKSRVYMTDRHGLVVRGRPGLEDFKAEYARSPDEIASWRSRDRASITLEEAVENARPTMLVGTSAMPGIFTEGVVRAMAKHNARPVIFPLSNPTTKSECTASDAMRWSEGRALVASGSPFDPVEIGGRRHRIGQCNNSFIFPGVGLGAWVGRVRRITDTMFLDAARVLATAVRESDLDEGSLFPQLAGIRDISHAVACAVIRRAVSEGHADAALAENVEERVRRAMWFPEYLPLRYESALAQR